MAVCWSPVWIRLPVYLRGTKGFKETVFPKGTIILEDKGYWDFSVIKARIIAENIFVTRIKENTVYEVIEELELPENEDQYILKDELIRLTGTKAKEVSLRSTLLSHSGKQR